MHYPFGLKLAQDIHAVAHGVAAVDYYRQAKLVGKHNLLAEDFNLCLAVVALIVIVKTYLPYCHHLFA